MALLTWRKRNAKGEEFGPVKYLEFDATLLEEFTRSAEVTRFPVENGAVLTDHYQPQPRAITLEVQVSNTPARPFAPIEGKVSETAIPVGAVTAKALDLKTNRAPVTGILGARFVTANASRFPKQRTASVLQFDGEVTRTIDVFKALDSIMETGQLVDVLLFGDVEYKNMVIVNVRTPRDAESGSTLFFSIDLVQIQFADTTTAKTSQPTESKHKKKSDAGNRNGKATDSQAEAERLNAEYY
jgi:hypothetical protein